MIIFGCLTRGTGTSSTSRAELDGYSYGLTSRIYSNSLRLTRARVHLVLDKTDSIGTKLSYCDIFLQV